MGQMMTTGMAALALGAAARFAWRALAMTTHAEAGGARTLFSREPAAADREPAAHARGERASAARPAVPAPVLASTRTPERPPRAAPASGSEILSALRARVDDVSYEPGNPNVLEITKYLDRGAQAGDADAKPADRVAIVRRDEGDRTVLVVTGSLDALTVPALASLRESLVAERRPELVLDLGGVEMIDSSGAGFLVSLHKRQKKQGGTLALERLRPQPLSVCKLLRLDQLLTVR
jgi:anti-sigma B factor antagonist